MVVKCEDWGSNDDISIGNLLDGFSLSAAHEITVPSLNLLKWNLTGLKKSIWSSMLLIPLQGWTTLGSLQGSTNVMLWRLTKRCWPPSSTTWRTHLSFSWGTHIHHVCPIKLLTIRNPLDYVGPEVEALLRLVIWRTTHCAKGSSVRSFFK